MKKCNKKNVLSRVISLMVAIAVSVSVFAIDGQIESIYPATPVFISTQSGNFTAEFDLEIKSGGASVCMIGLTKNTTSGAFSNTDAGLLIKGSVQIYDGGYGGSSTVRDAEGGAFAVANSGKYHFRFVINRTAMTYTVYATDITNSGVETKIATSFAIKSTNTEFSCITATHPNGNPGGKDDDGNPILSPDKGVIITNVTFTPANPDDPTNSDHTLPTVPAGLAASGITQTSFTLSWTASTDNVGVASYKVLRNGVQQGTTASTSMLISGLTAGTTYSMTVAASDSAGNWSAQSSPLNVTTTSTDPGNPTDPNEGVTTICRWKGNKQVAYTLTIDDAPLQRGDVPFVLSVTKPLGIPITWAVITRHMWDPITQTGDGKWTDKWVNDLVEAGHELCSHSTTHPDDPYVGETADSLNRWELYDSKREIEEMCPENGKCLTFCCCDDWCQDVTRPLISDYYIAARGVGHGKKFGPYSPTLDPTVKGGMNSIHTVGAKSLYPLNATDFLQSGGWWTESTHGANDRSSSDLTTAQFTLRMNEIYSMRDILWAGTLRDIAQYIYERNASKIQIISSTSSQIVLNLTHSLSTTICDFKFPITLKTEVYSDWSYAKVVQGIDTIEVNTVVEGDKRYAYYDAIPNGGEITMTPSSGTSGIEEVSVTDKSMLLFNSPNPFSYETNIFFKVPVAGVVNLKVYDVTGKEIATILNERRHLGEYNESWNASGFSAGIYFLRMTILPDGTSSPYVVSKRMLLTK